MDHKRSRVIRPLDNDGNHRSSYLMMLNNITNDLDILLSEFCQLPYTEPGEPPTCHNKPLRTFGKKPMQIENCSAFGGSSTSGTLTSTDSNHSNKDVLSGTLTSTDSNNSVKKPRSHSVQSQHLDVFAFSPTRALELPAYAEKQPSPSRSTSGSDLRQVTVLERLTKTHPIWFLPEVGRSGAVHLLKDRSPGIFIVRKSSRDDIMALSIQFPCQDGMANVDHYLIEPTEHGLHLQGSNKLFNAIPNLVAHYCDNKEDLPHRLVLPPAIEAAKTLQELNALAMLGQDFWTSTKYEGQSRSSSRSNLSDHSSVMNKSASEPISINKTPVQAYSQSETFIQNTPPKHSVIDFKSYLIQKPKESTEMSAKNCTKSVSSTTQSVHSKCSVSETKQSSHVTNHVTNHMTTNHHHLTTHESCLHEMESSRNETVLCFNGMNTGLSNRDSQVSVPYAKPNKSPEKDKSNMYFSTSLNLLHVPEDNYFTSNLSDKMSDYEDIWKGNYADPNASVHVDILQRLQPNLVNLNNNNVSFTKDTNASFSEETTFKERCFSEVCVVKDLNISLDKLNVSKEVTSSKEASTCSNKKTVNVESQNGFSKTVVTSEKSETFCENTVETAENVNNSMSVLKCTTVSECDSTTENTVKSREIVLTNTGFETIPEQESDIDTDSCHSNSCLSDEDAEADTEEGEVSPKINSVQTQTSPLWKSKAPPPLSGVRVSRKSVSTSSLSTLKSPVYSEPFDAISREERRNSSNAPRLPKKMRRRSAPAISLAKRRLGSFECQRLSPLLSAQLEDKSEVSNADKEMLQTLEAENENSAENEDVFEISMEHKLEHSATNTQGFVNGNTYEMAWVSEKSETGQKVFLTSEKTHVKPTASPRKVNNSKKPTSKQDEASNNRKSLIEVANRLKQKNLQNVEYSQSKSAKLVIDQFQFLEDFDVNHNPSSPTLNKFPVYNRQVSEETRMTSEGSTAEDMISNWNPELTLRPLKPFPVFERLGAMSEYDNLNNASYMAPSSVGTVFCKPWENSVLGKIMNTQTPSHSPHVPVNSPPPGHAPPPLPPPMDTHERIKAWQQSSQRYHSVPTDVATENRLSIISDMNSMGAVTFGGEKSSMYDYRVSSMEQNSQSQCQSQSDKAIVNEKSTTHSGGVGDKTSENIPLFGADFREKVAPILAHPRLLNKPQRNRNPDNKIRDYIIGLSKNRDTTFGSTIENFISCTQESMDTNPFNITRNVRQFMNGIKNYLVKHGEGELEDLIERERSLLEADEILNIDAILEGALHVCVIQPLKQDIYRLFVNEYTKNGNLQLLSSNIKYARTKTAVEIGIRKGLSPPDGPTLEAIKLHLTKMQKSYSPLKKLENLLAATSSIYKCVASKQQGNSSPTFGADDFLPMLIYVLVHCGMVSVEIEADYMWGLLHPSLLTGEGGYYLTSLSSAVLVLKNFRQMQETKTSQQEGKLPSISDMQGFLRFAIPDEQRDSIVWKTLPVRPSMTTRDVCSMIAHKFKFTNPQDYGLYTLENGEECKLMDMECPQMLKADRLDRKKECIFAYKRNAANIAWPKSVK